MCACVMRVKKQQNDDFNLLLSLLGAVVGIDGVVVFIDPDGGGLFAGGAVSCKNC